MNRWSHKTWAFISSWLLPVCVQAGTCVCVCVWGQKGKCVWKTNVYKDGVAFVNLLWFYFSSHGELLPERTSQVSQGEAARRYVNICCRVCACVCVFLTPQSNCTKHSCQHFTSSLSPLLSAPFSHIFLHLNHPNWDPSFKDNFYWAASCSPSPIIPSPHPHCLKWALPSRENRR